MKSRQRSEWYKFYRNRQNMIYKKHIETRYEDFINAIINAMPDKGRKPIHIHEAGCGAANVSLALFKKLKAQGINFHISMSDKCPDMLELAHENLPDGYKALIDITKDNLPSADVSFSHGVLEHFDNEQITKIVSNQLKSSKVVLHYVPSAKYKKPSFGDERLLSVQEWQEICNPTSIVEFNDGYDLILVWDLDKRIYPNFIFKDNQVVKKVPSRDGHISYEGMSIPFNDAFFLTKKSFQYPSAYYNPLHTAPTYRYPTANEELIYGDS